MALDTVPMEVTILSPSETSLYLSPEDNEEEDIVSEPTYTTLAASIMRTFETNKNARKDSGIEDEIFTSLRDYNGQYSAEDLRKIADEGGSSIYMNLTATKCRAAMSWIRDILQSANEDAFSIKPTPIPELPEDLNGQLEQAFEKELQVKAQDLQAQTPDQPVSPKAAQDTIVTINKDKRDTKEAILAEINLEALDQMLTMERKVKDDLKEGNWDQALSDFIEDFCIFPTAFMKGPVVTKQDRLRWSIGKPVVVSDYAFLNKRVSPIDIYPSPSSTTIQKGDLVEHMRMGEDELHAFKSVPGYFSDAIDKVLENGSSSCSWLNTGIEDERATEEMRGTSVDANAGLFHALHYWGLASYDELEELGIAPPEEDETKPYEIEAILVGNEVIKCKLNDDPLKRRPYYKASYQNIPGSFWGRSLPNLMRDIQRMCNACARALANNMGLAAGPQIELYIDRLADSGDIENIKPLKIWQVTNDPTGSSGRAINFFQVPSIANELLGVYDKFEQKADDATGIPRYSYGNEKVGGAAQALADYEPVITPYGYSEISKLVVGDIVCNNYGTTSTVTGVYPQGEVPLFRVNFSNNEYVDCDLNHRWAVRSHHNREFKTYTLEQILDKGLFRKTKNDKKNPKGVRPKWMLPAVSPVMFTEKEVFIDPYTMGVLIGDGDNRARVCSADVEVFENIPYDLGKIDRKDNNTAYSRTILGIKKELTRYLDGVTCYDKFIPEDYLYNSVNIRREVLKGLMDTDGCCSKNGYLFFSTVSERLAKDFIQLVRSLGGSCNGYSKTKEVTKLICERETTSIEGYRIYFKLDGDVFKLNRKQNLIKDYDKRFIYITGITYIGTGLATCITVDSDNHLFLTKSFLPTHNTASGLSMLLESATKSIKDAIRHIDIGLIIPRVEYQFYWNVLKNEFKYTGDINVVAYGSNTLTLKGAQQAKRQEFLQITANQSDQELMGPEGRAELLRQLGKDLGLTVNIVPSRLELRKKREEQEAQIQQMQQAQQDQAGQKTSASIEATKIQIEGQERMHQSSQQLRMQELQLQAQNDQERNQIERDKMQVSLNNANTKAIADSEKANIDAMAKKEVARTNIAAKLVSQ